MSRSIDIPGAESMAAMKTPSQLSLSASDGCQIPPLVVLILMTCLSMTVVLHNSTPEHRDFWHAVASTIVLCAFIPLFARARFSFGYFAGISFYSMIIGFLWASYFMVEQYDHVLARWSAVASLLLFLVPALFQNKPPPRALTLSPRAMNRLMLVLLVLSAVILAISATYGFALVGLSESEQLRSSFPRPGVLNYFIGWSIGAVLPFAFAYFAWHRRYVLAAAAVLLMWCSYPVLLNKSVVFGGFWLPYLFVLFRLFEPKRATVYSLLILMLPGIVAYHMMEYGWISPDGTLGHALRFVLGTVNVRLFGYPTLAMNNYSDFFAHHPLTHFCQIGVIRAIYGCPYPFQLGASMAEAYHMGSMNGSLFATEGIASVGPTWAPLSALVCGLIVSLGNSASVRLPAPVMATSAGFAVQQALLNAPLTVCLLSNGLLVLWLLWAVSPPMEGGEGQA
jgi:hypothetical protein